MLVHYQPYKYAYLVSVPKNQKTHKLDKSSSVPPEGTVPPFNLSKIAIPYYLTVNIKYSEMYVKR